MFLTLTVLLCAHLVYAQELDSVLLEEVAVEGHALHRYATGANVKSISIDDADQDLSTALTGQPSVYFKTYGNGQQASITFRGTSANHTNVLWHGISANYPTLGQMDFSQWPLWMLESISLQAGNAGALYGSGSIGGTVMLDSEIPQISKTEAEGRVEVGSYGYRFFGGKAAYRQGVFSGQTKLFLSDLANNFPYSYQGKDVKQQNASSRNFGLQQQLKLAVGDHQLLFDGSVSLNDREIQPSKEMETSSNNLQTENLRMALVHQYEQASYSLTNTLAYLSNSTLFNDSLRTTSRQYSAQTMLWVQHAPWISARYGVNANYFTVLSDNYDGVAQDANAAVFASVEITPSEWWKFTTNIRQSVYKKSAPFTPSVGTEIKFLDRHKVQLMFLGQAAFGYRYPTLNERFWSPGGNQNLSPERSFGLEGGLKSIVKGENIKSTSIINLYRTYSKDWIFWTQGSSPTPKNIRSVLLMGLEVSECLETKNTSFKTKLEANYSLNFSINKTGEYRGSQMIYSPLHSGALSLSSSYHGWTAQTNGTYTGYRFTTLDNTFRDSQAAFTIFDFGLAKEIKWGALHTKVGGRVKNLTDQDYENLPNLAMPGRNYQCYLSIKL